MKIEFKVVKNDKRIPSTGNKQAFLHVDNWDDWFKYTTMYYLTVYDEIGQRHDIGSIKIGEIGMKNGRPNIPDSFKKLKEGFFSLGQDADFYENIAKLDDDLRNTLVTSLNDVVHDQALFARILDEDVTKTSILRSVSPASVRGQFNRLLQGGAKLTRYKFKYEIESSKKIAGLDLEFNVIPESSPPTNIHILIGRNGVGKTHLLNNMVHALAEENAEVEKVGRFSLTTSDGNPEDLEEGPHDIFSGVVSVSFSAFDPFDPLPEQRDKTAGIQYSYVGLKRTTNRGGDRGTPMSHEMLTNEFVKSLNYCLKMGRAEQLQRAISKLEADPMFKDAVLIDLLDISSDPELKSRAASFFKKLSSGHGIVLLTLTKLIQTVEEKTLVLLDEPEAHLHPPLLAAFIRALSDLLIHKNGVAIIATHSPVIAQEVPACCVWKMRRSGFTAIVERPGIETFGENVGVLTREIFGLEVTRAGFHQLLSSIVDEENDFDRVVSRFGGRIGQEAKAIARALIAEKENNHESEI